MKISEQLTVVIGKLYLIEDINDQDKKNGHIECCRQELSTIRNIIIDNFEAKTIEKDGIL